MSTGAVLNSHTVTPRTAARMLGEIVKYVRASDRVLPMVAMQLDTNAIGLHSLRITATDASSAVRARIPLPHAPSNTDGEPIDSYRWPVRTATLDRAIKALRGATGRGRLVIETVGHDGFELYANGVTIDVPSLPSRTRSERDIAGAGPVDLADRIIGDVLRRPYNGAGADIQTYPNGVLARVVGLAHAMEPSHAIGLEPGDPGIGTASSLIVTAGSRFVGVVMPARQARATGEWPTGE